MTASRFPLILKGFLLSRQVERLAFQKRSCYALPYEYPGKIDIAIRGGFNAYTPSEGSKANRSAVPGHIEITVDDSCSPFYSPVPPKKNGSPEARI